MRNIFLATVKFLHKILVLVGLRSSRHWGVVYDSVTKQPVDPVVVKLINAHTGEVVASSITNLAGEYGFMASPGVYKIFAYRANFIFPSTVVRGSDDGVYKHIYTGQMIEFTGGSDVISLNIPLDPASPDWNQQDKLRVVKVRPRLEYLVTLFIRLCFWALLVYVLFQYFIWSQDDIWSYIALPLLGVLVLSWFSPEVRLWGRVASKRTGEGIPNVSLVVFHEALPDVVIAHANTTFDGKFFMRLAKGKYRIHLNVPAIGDVPSSTASHIITVGSEGLLNSEFHM